MGNEKLVVFGPFRLNSSSEYLWKGSRQIKLRPKAFAVLAHLVARPGQLVTKEELLNAVWPGTFVGEAVLKVSIREIREALGDEPKSPRFIETAHRRGYRFIGQITGDGSPGPEGESAATRPLAAAPAPARVVGREQALARMRRWLEKTLRGERQIVFVTGEAGMGKTSVVDAFARSISADGRIQVSRGQCLEQYGTSEAYLPVLEAIGRLCREQPRVGDVLRAHAPMWLLQMPSLVGAAERESLSRGMSGATRERMLREMGEALEALTAEAPLALILEDLHWSDYSTLDLISYLARQRQPAQLMLIGTYRPVELIVSGHPLKGVKRELLAKQQCEELPLGYLNWDAIVQYLSVRFPANRFPLELAGLIHERTEGNPLFMVNAVDYLVAEGLIAEGDEGWALAGEIENIEVRVPDSIKQMIEKQIDHLDAGEQRMLEAASAAGAEFSTTAVAAALGEDRGRIEAQCEQLDRQRQLIQDCGVQVLAGGEAVPRYGFIHALYQNVLYERMPSSRRVQLHRRIGEQLEALYGERTPEIAAELAMHFERGAKYDRAVRYLQQAAENDIRRFAYQDAIVLSRRGLGLLERLPDTAERSHQELGLHLTLGVPLIATEGYAAPNVGETYLRARELCRRLGDLPEISQVLWGVWTFHMLRAELQTAREIAEEILRVSERLPYPGLAMRGHWAMETTFMHMGECALAVEHFKKALSQYDPQRHLEDAFLYAQNPGVAIRCFASWALWFLGRPEEALRQIEEALTLARALVEPHGLAHALCFAAILHQFLRDARKVHECVEAAVTVSNEHGLVLYQAIATVLHGWTQLERGPAEEAIDEMRRGLEAQRATGTDLVRPHFLALLAEALDGAGKIEEGLRILEEAVAMADRTGERYYQPELHRLKGELLLRQSAGRALSASAAGTYAADMQSPPVLHAERCFQESIAIARRQNSRSFELRTAISLGRLYRSQGRNSEARDLLQQIFGAFTEGFDTTDLREAKTLLDEIGSQPFGNPPGWEMKTDW